jgi:hypothetical protein
MPSPSFDFFPNSSPNTLSHVKEDHHFSKGEKSAKTTSIFMFFHGRLGNHALILPCCRK